MRIQVTIRVAPDDNGSRPDAADTRTLQVLRFFEPWSLTSRATIIKLLAEDIATSLMQECENYT